MELYISLLQQFWCIPVRRIQSSSGSHISFGTGLTPEALPDAIPSLFILTSDPLWLEFWLPFVELPT